MLIEFESIFFRSFHGLNTMKKILTNIPVKMICLIVQVQYRFDQIIKKLKLLLPLFVNYRNNITLILTCFEIDFNELNKQDIKKAINLNFKFQNILFADKHNYNEISNSLEKLQKKMSNIENMVISNRELFSLIIAQDNIGLYKEKEKMMEEFEDTYKLFMNELKNIKDSDLRRAFYFAFKHYKESIIEKFTEIVKTKTEYTDDIINEVIDFNNQIYYSFNRFKKMIESEMEIKINYSNNKKCNEFRRCPHCGLIWLQIQGCNDVICGERTEAKDIITGFYKNYIVKYENHKITIQIEEINNFPKGTGDRIFGLKVEEEEKNIYLKSIGKQEIKLLGCGYGFKWDEAEDMTKRVIDFLKEMPINDYYSDVIKIADNFNFN